MRMQFACEAAGNSVKVHIGAHEGTYKPWWLQIQVEVYGYDSTATYSLANAAPQAAIADPEHHRVLLTVADDGQAKDISVTAAP